MRSTQAGRSSYRIVEESAFQIKAGDLNILALERNVDSLSAVGGVEGLASKLKTDLEDGIPDSTVGLRQRVFGFNVFAEPPHKTFFGLFVESFKDLTLRILTVLSVFSLALELWLGDEGGWVESVAIMVAVLIVSMVGTINNWSKERQFRDLNKVKENRLIKVVREGKRLVVSIFDIVVGDICILESGDRVPADGVFVEGFSLATDESSMTGEPDLVKKSSVAPFMLSGTQVGEGSGRMMVTAVGANSEWGKAIDKLAVASETTPLQDKLRLLANHISKGGLGGALAVFGVLCLTYSIHTSKHHEWSYSSINVFVDYFMIAVAIVVVAVPEGLPLAVTMSLAYSMKKMMKDNNLVRHLSACETMGGATTICADKTGTLTENRMTVVKGYFFGTFYDKVPCAEEAAEFAKSKDILFEAVSVNTKAVISKNGDGRPSFVGNKTEGALLWMLQSDFGYDWNTTRRSLKKSIRQVYSFSSERKRMSTIVGPSSSGAHGKLYRLYVNGAAEIVVDLCTQRLREDGVCVPISSEDRAELEDVIRRMASDGLRTLCVAYRDLGTTDRGEEWNDATHTPEEDLVCLAVVGIKDPLRKEVKDAVAQCLRSGIAVRMVTGDSILTATHIAKECGILQGDGLVMEGREFRAMTDEQRNHILPKLQVLARSTPSDKFILVHRLRCLGEVVAVTGDGTNDAPALREADVGLSMGLAGTEVAKEASDIVILDDNFSSIVKAVLWGRSVYENIRKFLQFQLTANFAALAVVFVAALAQRDLPLTAVQLLWVNLIMDTLAALALATEPPMPELLERKPYGRYDPLISSIMYRNIVGQSLFQVATVLSIMFAAPVVLDMEPDSRVVTTICFNTFVWCQLFNEFNARRINESDRWNTNVFQGLWPTRSPLFCLIWLSTAAAQVIIVQYGGAATQTTALSLREWVFCLAVGKLSLPLGMLLRTIRVRPRSEAVPKDIVEARKRAYGEEEYDERQRLLDRSGSRSTLVGISLRHPSSQHGRTARYH